MDDDIEILDIFDNNKKNNIELSSSKEEKKDSKEIKSNNDKEKDMTPKKKEKKTRKKRKVKAKGLQLVFCIISILFLLTCCVIYGSRFIKYYRVFNPKIDSESGETSLANYIKFGKSEYSCEGESESGLRSSQGNFIYYGDVQENYLKFNNLLWRIVRVNMDNTIDIVLDDYATLLPWNKESTSFAKADIYAYLKDDFMKNISTDYLSEISFCDVEVGDLTEIKQCTETDRVSSYVTLLDITTFLNSTKGKKSYLINEDEVFWLTNYGDEKVWHTNGTNVSQSDSTALYEVRPMIRLKNTVTYSEGEGTKESPFVVGSTDKIMLGSKINLDDDIWTVYDIDGKTVKLVSDTLLKKQLAYSKSGLNYDESSLKEYLNTTYLDGLSYKDKLVDAKWYIGQYEESIKEIKEKEVEAKVGILNLLDFKFNNELKTYFLSTGNKESIYVYENPIRLSKPTVYRYARPCIAVKMDTLKDFKLEDGIFVEEEV